MIKPNSYQITSLGLFLTMVIASIFVALDRGGWLAWSGILLGCIGIILSMVLRKRGSIYCFIGFFAVITSAWCGVAYYVYSSWELGEVIDISITRGNSEKSFRTWIVDHAGIAAVVYDADPETAEVLASIETVTVVRQGSKHLLSLRVIPEHRMAAEELNEIYRLFEEKYHELNPATDIYYLMMGRPKDNQLLILYLGSSLQ
ncbi:MAG: hypothetical protein VB957_06550 [Pseudomonadales bacterium]